MMESRNALDNSGRCSLLENDSKLKEGHAKRNCRCKSLGFGVASYKLLGIASSRMHGYHNKGCKKPSFECNENTVIVPLQLNAFAVA